MEYVYRALCGSHAQGLVTPTSDKDWKYLTLPTPKDLIEGNKRASTGKDENGDDYDAHDLRQLPDLLWKANPTYLEILFPREFRTTCIGPECQDVIVDWMIPEREKFARMNLPYLYRAGKGMYLNRMKNLHTKEGEKGYNYKNACHAVRGLKILIDYAEYDFTDFETCILMPKKTRDELMAIKCGQLEEDEFLEIVRPLQTKMEALESRYLAQEPDKELYYELESKLGKAIWNDVRSEEWWVPQ